MTINQMDVLAGIMTEHFYSHIQDKTIGAWVDEYESIREEISKYCEERANGETTDSGQIGND